MGKYLLITLLVFRIGDVFGQIELGCNSSDSLHFSCFPGLESLPAQTNWMVHPASHTTQLLLSHGDTLSNGIDVSGASNDLAAYVPIAGSSRHGYLLVNHETAVGAVTQLEIKYDSISRLWNILNSSNLDFSNPGIHGISLPCSGNTTPWGTVIIGEEIFTNVSDLNADGYHDYGWLVEIDPVSGSVVDYENDGLQDKLWALGKMAHENIAIANDTVAYYGNDQQYGLIYKFVADSAQKLNEGTLYVLKLDTLSQLSNPTPVPTVGEWIQVPNFTQLQRNTCVSKALSVGGTNFNYVEDVEIDPISGDIFFASKSIDSPGAVYRFTDTGDSVVNFQVFIENGYDYTIEYLNGIQTNAQISEGADNLAFDDHGNLYVLQDGDQSHIWFVRNDHVHDINNKVSVLLHTPDGSEPTGLTFTPDNAFGFYSIQHPTSGASQTDIAGSTYTWNKSMTFVIARDEFLGLDSTIQISVFDNNFNYYQNLDTINFNTQISDGTYLKDLFIKNVGTKNLFLEHSALSGDAEFGTTLSNQYLINPGDSLYFTFSFSPLMELNYTAQIQIFSNNYLTPYTLKIIGNGLGNTDIEENTDHLILIYPNPASDGFFIKNSKISLVEIYSTSGQLVSTFRNKSEAAQLHVDISNLVRGLYLVRVYSENSIKTETLIKP